MNGNEVRLIKRLKKHEGFSEKPYRDSEGLLTVGYGHLLERDYSKDECERMLVENDLPIAENDAVELCKSEGVSWDTLYGIRQEVLIEMAFNLGRPRLAKFKKMWAALAECRYTLAAAEMLDSKWADQVGQRALTLAALMKRGGY